MVKNRTFTVESSCINVSGGRYKSSSPSSAAKKAASKLFKKASGMSKFKNIRKITFSIRETTSGSDKTEYHYKAGRVKLTQPVVRVINGVEIVNHFKIQIDSIEGKIKTKSKSLKCVKTSSSTGGEPVGVEPVEFEI
jgi:hypothetical protein